MRKDPSTIVTEFIQGGSLGDDANTSTNVNTLETCDSTPNACMARNLDFAKELRDDVTTDEESSSASFGPILNSLSSSSSTTEVETATATAKPKRVSKSVRFGACTVRSYNQILGDHPLCAVGCPIALGWKVVREEGYSVEDYEAVREPLRKKKGAKSPTMQRKRHSADQQPMERAFKYINSQLRLSPHERRERLSDYTDEQIRREWSFIQKQPKRSIVKEGLRQFREVGRQYAGF